jgi:Domain of unknown function (DUF5655)
MMDKYTTEDPERLSEFLAGKPACTLMLFNHFIEEFKKIGPVTVHPGKTMIGIAIPHKKIAYVSQLGRNFIHVVFQFRQAYYDNLCFQKIIKWPGDDVRFTHHFRMFYKEDVNDEVRGYMRMAYES